METRADEFVTQAREHLTALEQLLLSLEKPGESADDRERLDGCLRLVHSLKGDAGFLGFTTIRTLANAMETVLEAMRDQEAPISAAAIERLLMARDRLATLVDDLDNSHGADLREILAQLEPAATRTQQFWDIDLRQLDEKRTAPLGEFFTRFERCGVASDPRIVLGPHDLTRGLPRGRFTFRLGSAPRCRWKRSASNSGCRRPLRKFGRNGLAAIPRSRGMGPHQRSLTRRAARRARTLGDFEDPQLDLVSDI